MPQQYPDMALKLGNALAEQCVAIRMRRRLVEEQWLRARRVWMNVNYEQRFISSDTSAATYQIPAARRAAERTIVRGVKLLTPNVKWFEVSPMGSTDQQKLTNCDQFMWYVLRKRIRSRTIISQLVRSMFLYGLCHLKTSVAVKNTQVWPYQRAVDPFSFYVWPETAATNDEADIVFEDFLFSYEKYQTFVRLGIVEDIKRSELTKPEWPYHLVERMAYQGITDPTQSVDIVIKETAGKLEQTTAAFTSLSELWITREDKLYQVYILWNHKDGPRCVGFIQSQYDEPMYRSAVHRAVPGELYTHGMMSDIDELGNIQNDQFNKFMDATDWEQGFVAVNDSVVGRRDKMKMKGRAVWEFSDDPRIAMQFLAPPITSTNQLRAWQIELGLINSMAGTGTIAEGQPGRNMPRAGFAVNNLVNLGMADIQDAAELIEQECLTPGLSDIYKVSSWFIPEEQLLHIPGGEGLYGNILKREDIVGDYEFEWIGSLQFQDNNQRAQQLLIFLNMLPGLAPFLQQQGYQINMVDLIQMIWRYALGERGLLQVVQPIPPPMPMQGMPPGNMPPPGMPGQPIPQQGAPQQGQPMPQGGQPPQSGAPISQQAAMPGMAYQLPAITNGYIQR